MSRVRTPISVVVTIIVSLVIAAGAVAAAALTRPNSSTAGPPTRSNPPPTSGSQVDSSGCKRAPCTVLGTVVVAGSTVDLVADAGGTSGRLRIGGPGAGRVIETTITKQLGVKLTGSSLQCMAGPISACLIRGDYDDGVAGEVIVGRSGAWSALENRFQSDAGYLALSDVSGSVSPEIVAVQQDCSGDTECTGKPVFAQVFDARGAELGCTRHHYAKLANMPGYPNIQLRGVALVDC